MRGISIILVCFALARVAGLDLAVMQMQAWAEMIYKRSDQGIAQAVYSTFSGDSPCEKCTQLKEQRDERRGNEFTLSSLDKLKLPLAPDREEGVQPQHLDESTLDFPPYIDLVSEVYLGIEAPPPRA